MMPAEGGLWPYDEIWYLPCVGENLQNNSRPKPNIQNDREFKNEFISYMFIFVILILVYF